MTGAELYMTQLVEKWHNIKILTLMQTEIVKTGKKWDREQDTLSKQLSYMQMNHTGDKWKKKQFE